MAKGSTVLSHYVLLQWMRQATAGINPNILQKFTLFIKLLPELQDKIWEWYALMYPRVVDLAMSEEQYVA